LGPRPRVRLCFGLVLFLGRRKTGLGGARVAVEENRKVCGCETGPPFFISITCLPPLFFLFVEEAEPQVDGGDAAARTRRAGGRVPADCRRTRHDVRLPRDMMLRFLRRARKLKEGARSSADTAFETSCPFYSQSSTWSYHQLILQASDRNAQAFLFYQEATFIRDRTTRITIQLQ
jgi:hypothetical protein